MRSASRPVPESSRRRSGNASSDLTHSGRRGESRSWKITNGFSVGMSRDLERPRQSVHSRSAARYWLRTLLKELVELGVLAQEPIPERKGIGALVWPRAKTLGVGVKPDLCYFASGGVRVRLFGPRRSLACHVIPKSVLPGVPPGHSNAAHGFSIFGDGSRFNV